MKPFFFKLDKLCSPAYFYFVVSIISLIMIGLQNVNSRTTYCIGNYECPVQNKALIFIVQLLYVLFWTWILNLICKEGYSTVSWALVLVPFIMMFLWIISFMIHGKEIAM